MIQHPTTPSDPADPFANANDPTLRMVWPPRDARHEGPVTAELPRRPEPPVPAAQDK